MIFFPLKSSSGLNWTSYPNSGSNIHYVAGNGTTEGKAPRIFTSVKSNSFFFCFELEAKLSLHLQNTTEG